MSTPPPGWFPDPHDSRQQRYWNGVMWSTQTRPAPVAPTPAPLVTPVGRRAWLWPTVVAVAFLGGMWTASLVSGGPEAVAATGVSAKVTATETVTERVTENVLAAAADVPPIPPPVQPVATGPDLKAELGCQHFRNVMGDFSTGILNDFELREKLREVYDDAMYSEEVGIAPAAQAMLAAVTQSDPDALVTAATQFDAACESLGL